MNLLRRLTASRPVPAATAPPNEGMPTEEPAAAQNHAGMLENLCSLVERDIDRVSDDLAAQNAQAVEHGKRMNHEAASIAAEARIAASSAGLVSQCVEGVATATEELAAAGREIARQAAGSTAQAQGAVAKADQAAATGLALQDATNGIANILRGIVDIAGRTNLLALNATIEAARAGEVGRGFAVVAGEVKGLAVQTKALTDDISRQISHIRHAAGETADAIQSMGETVRTIDAANASVAAAVEQQDATIGEIARSLQEAAKDSQELAGAVESVSGRAATVTTLCDRTIAAMAETTSMIDDLGAGLVVSLRTASVTDRRAVARVPVVLPATLYAEGPPWPAPVLNLSSGGALVRVNSAHAAIVAQKGHAVLDLHTIGRIETERVGGSPARLHLRFCDLPSDTAERLGALLAEINRDDQRFIDAAITAAAQVGAALESALAAGSVGERHLFHPDYQAVAGSDPLQHLTQATTIADRLFPAIQEPLLRLDPRVVFAAAVDCNGYLPRHNEIYNQPQRDGDHAWNAAHCRSRRIFNDRAGLAAARCSGEYLLQTYERDMGGAQRVLLKEADAPIMVRGQHWGGFRLCYKIAR
jgi:uncharacterized protein YoxC